MQVNEFVPREVVDKLMKKANTVWQLILGLSCYGGLRTPSETLSLRWEDIDWELNRMSIPEPKVEHHEGRRVGSCPIFPELRSILDEAFYIFGDKSEYMVCSWLGNSPRIAQQSYLLVTEDDFAKTAGVGGGVIG